MRNLPLLTLLVLGTGILWSPGYAQNPDSPENHYRTYALLEQGRIVVSGELVLRDEFGLSSHTSVSLERFVIPVDKNSEGIPNPSFHQTWWEIDDPQNPRTVEVANQFGSQIWSIDNGRFLVLPASKNSVSGTPPPPDLSNHYKCYRATGPAVDASVWLNDQFGSMTTIVGQPKLLCNPVEKRFEGEVFPIVDPSTHLACYNIESVHEGFFSLRAIDQFGSWQLTTVETRMLCVPSMRMEPVQTESSTWGQMKSIYR